MVCHHMREHNVYVSQLTDWGLTVHRPFALRTKYLIVPDWYESLT